EHCSTSLVFTLPHNAGPPPTRGSNTHTERESLSTLVPESRSTLRRVIGVATRGRLRHGREIRQAGGLVRSTFEHTLAALFAVVLIGCGDGAAGPAEIGGDADGLFGDSQGGQEVTDSGATDTEVAACTPGDELGCRNGGVIVCLEDGATTQVQPCSRGLVCEGRGCREVDGTVLLLMDTSGSMNWVPSQARSARNCDGEGCPPWDFPICDHPSEPRTRLGAAKVAVSRMVASEAAANLRFVLQRFPAVGRGRETPTCSSGYSTTTSPGPGIPSDMTGDSGAHQTTEDGWFGSNLGEIIVAGPTDVGEHGRLLRWVDFVEAVSPTAAACEEDVDCDSNVCVGAVCQQVDDPELRAVGGTPIGKSLFYAGEFLRHRVLVQGKACQVDADCGSTHHTCVAGACDDPIRHCRPNAIVVVTDGAESDNHALTDFFHPRVQAKRLRYGLGCSVDAGCGLDAACDMGQCQPSGIEAIRAMGTVCSSGGALCTTDDECPDPCASSGGECASTCSRPDVDFIEGGGNDRLVGADGVPLSLPVHVLDATGAAERNVLLATYGGGVHRSVDAEDVDAFVAALTAIVGDLKQSRACVVE
ncbi:MAG: hypothetical protein ACI9MR_001933, partial [Myxococcota bacterium]